MGPSERRYAVMEILCRRRQETMANLAFEFGVSIRTIRNDIDILSLSYPLETVRGRYNGGVKVMDGFYMERKYLKPEQRALLVQLSGNLVDKDLAVMKSILREFSLNQ